MNYNSLSQPIPNNLWAPDCLGVALKRKKKVLRLKGGCGDGEKEEEDKKNKTAEKVACLKGKGGQKICQDIMNDIIQTTTSHKEEGGEETLCQQGVEDNIKGIGEKSNVDEESGWNSIDRNSEDKSSEDEKELSLSASFKMLCYNRSSTSLFPTASEEEIYSSEEEEFITEDKKGVDNALRPACWHYQEIYKKHQRPGPMEPPRTLDMAYGDNTIDLVEEEDGITVADTDKDGYRRGYEQMEDLQLARDDQRRVGGGVYRSNATGLENIFLHIKKGPTNIIGITWLSCEKGCKPKPLSQSWARMDYEKYEYQGNKRYRKSCPKETDSLGYYWLGFGGDLPFPGHPANEFHLVTEIVDKSMHFPGKHCDRKNEAPGASQLLCNNRSCGIIIWHLTKVILTKSQDGNFAGNAKEHFARVTFKDGKRLLLWTNRHGNQTWWESLDSSPDQETFHVPPSSLERAEEIFHKRAKPLYYIPPPGYSPVPSAWQEMSPVERLSVSSPWYV